MVRSTDLRSFLLAAVAAGLAPNIAQASDCRDPAAAWLACEDFEQGSQGWEAWFAQSPFVECVGCSDGANNPDRILLDEDPENAFDGDWSLYLPAAESAQYQGAELAFRSCVGEKQQNCPLQNYDRLYFRTRVKLAEDHQYVHHFLSISGTRPGAYWEGVGNAGCRPNGYRKMGTTVDFNADNELFFYTYYPEMGCDSGGYCSGEYAQGICDGCAEREMPCENGLECCWGNLFRPEPAVVLPRGEWACLEMMVEANTPGQNDGVMAFWLDDQLALEVDDMHWRDVPELGLNRVNLGHYVEVGDADQSNRVWFDDFTVSTERIGCSTSVPPQDTDGADSGAPSWDSGPPGPTSGSSDGGEQTSQGDDSPSSGSGGGVPDTDGGETAGPELAGADEGDRGCNCRHGSDDGRSLWVGTLMLGLIALRRRRDG